MSYATPKTDPVTGVTDYKIEWFENVTIDPEFDSVPLDDLNPLCPAILHQLKEHMVPNMYIAGGSCITHLNPMHQYNDIDIYLSSQEAMNHIVNVLTVFGFTELTGKSPSPKIKVWSDTLNVIQLIYVEKITNLEMLLSSFDLTICKIGFDKDTIAIGQFTAVNVKHKLLSVPTKPQSAEKTLIRLFKYVAKGYSLTESDVKELVKVIKYDKTGPVLDINKPDDLNQLRNLLDALSNKQDKLSKLGMMPQQQMQQPIYPPLITVPDTGLIGPGYLNECPKCGIFSTPNSYHYC